jgi:Uma2 family endonuclease
MKTTLLIQTKTTPFRISLPATTPITGKEFDDFCQINRHLRIERTASGEIVIMPPVFSDTGNRNFNLTVQLGIWAAQDGTGLGFDSSTGFTLPNGAMRSPDASWLSRKKWDALTDEEKASFAPVCPDFVIELRSASDNLKDLKEKMLEYLENGVSLAWLIDRQKRTVYIYRPNQEVKILDNPEQVSGSPELSGFSLSIA